MKLLYVTSSLPFGPGEAFIIPEVTELRRQGHTVRVVPVYPRGKLVHEGAKDLVDPPLVQRVVSWPVLRGAGWELLRAPRRALRALRLLMTSRPHHLLKNVSVYPKGLWLARVARHWGAEHIHAHWAGTSASLAMVASEVSGIPWSFTAHRWDILEGNLLARKATHATFARFISENGMQLALAKGVPRQSAFVLHLGVYLPNRGSAAESCRLSEPRRFRLLCPAALIPRKGHSYLIEALSLLDRDVELWLAGDGELRGALQAKVSEVGLQDVVTFLGQCPREALLELYSARRVDAVVLPSLHEGIPVALMEAMSYGIPVVATRTGGVPELLEGGAGLLVPPGDPSALAEAIRSLVDDGELAQKLGEAGRRRVQEEFAVEKVVSQLTARFKRDKG